MEIVTGTVLLDKALLLAQAGSNSIYLTGRQHHSSPISGIPSKIQVLFLRQC